MAYKITYKASVERDLKKLAKPEIERVLSRIEKDLGSNPDKGELIGVKYFSRLTTIIFPVASLDM